MPRSIRAHRTGKIQSHHRNIKFLDLTPNFPTSQLFQQVFPESDFVLSAQNEMFVLKRDNSVAFSFGRGTPYHGVKEN